MRNIYIDINDGLSDIIAARLYEIPLAVDKKLGFFVFSILINRNHYYLMLL